MIFRKLGLGAVIISLALLLSSCVEVKGELSVSSSARINGEIIYTLSKSSAAGVGLATLADVKSEASTNPEAQIGFCKDAPITEDASNYILKCALKDVLSDSGDISASITGGNIVFRYKANLDPSSAQGDQTNFGSVSITIRFLDPVISFKENKAGLVTRVDDRTYRISGSANEPINIEITANLASSSGAASTGPAPAPSTSTNPTGESSAAVDAANKAAADKAAADLKAKQEAEAKAAADLKAKQEADAKAAADKAAADLKAKKAAEAKATAAKALAAAKAKAAAAAAKKTTITCVKGKLTKKVTAIKPICPKGYKKK